MKRNITKDAPITFMIGRENLAVTIFVPWDCRNNCKFCTSKIEYQYQMDIDEAMDKIKKAIIQFHKIGIKEFVFTGGEPLADCHRLKTLLDLIDTDRNIYINTTFPFIDEADKKLKIAFVNRSKKITALNISRHSATEVEDSDFFASNILEDIDMQYIRKPIRINTVFNLNLNLDTYLQRWYYVALKREYDTRFSLRADYRFIDFDNLHSMMEPGFIQIATHPELTYQITSGCSACNNDEFVYNHGFTSLRVSYHRGIEESTIQVGNQRIVNDIIIQNDGTVVYDWDGKNEGMDELLQTLKTHYMNIEKAEKEQLKSFKKVEEKKTASYPKMSYGMTFNTCGSSSC